LTFYSKYDIKVAGGGWEYKRRPNGKP